MATCPLFATVHVTCLGTISEQMCQEMYMRNNAAYMPFLLRGATSASIPNGITENFSLLPGQAEKAFLPVLMMGATGDNTNAEQAKEFISCALEAGIQSLDLWSGFPVNAAALDAMQEQEEVLYTYASSGPNGELACPCCLCFPCARH